MRRWCRTRKLRGNVHDAARERVRDRVRSRYASAPRRRLGLGARSLDRLRAGSVGSGGGGVPGVTLMMRWRTTPSVIFRL